MAAHMTHSSIAWHVMPCFESLRLSRLQARGVYESNERVASIDNDVADLISRGDITEALRFPRQCGLRIVKCEVDASYRQLPALSTRA